jgi:hypothetical protein
VAAANLGWRDNALELSVEMGVTLVAPAVVKREVVCRDETLAIGSFDDLMLFDWSMFSM